MKCTLVFVSGVFLWKIVCTGTQLSRRHNRKLPSTGSLRQRAVSFSSLFLSRHFRLSFLSEICLSQTFGRLIFPFVAHAGNDQHDDRYYERKHLIQFILVGMNRCRIYRPPKSMDARIHTFGLQIVKMTSAMASQPRSPNASFDQTPQA